MKNTFNFHLNKKLGVLALSSAVAPAVLEAGSNFLMQQNVNVEMINQASESYGKDNHLFACDSVSSRVKAFTKSLTYDFVISARGGYGSAELLPQIYMEQVAKKTIFIGYSDFTILMNTYVNAGGVAVHGVALETLAKANTHEAAKLSWEQLEKVLSGKVNELYQNLELQSLTSLETAEGTVIGGNLSVLLSLLGTKYFPDFKDKILFLEEIGEKPYRVHRMLLQLKQAGELDKLNGILLGDFSKCVHDKGLGPDASAAIKDVLGKLKIPVYAGFPAGHTLPNSPIILGMKARLNKHSLGYPSFANN